MTIRQLKSFVRAAETKSFTKAAEAGYISTSSFVQQINALEAAVGFKLFSRTHRGVSLTKAGEGFLEYAKQTISAYEEGCKVGKQLDEASVKSLRIACSNDGPPEFSYDILSTFYEKYPDVKISPVYSECNDHCDEVRKGNVDISFIDEPNEDYLQDLCYLPIVTATFCFCMRHNHPLAHKRMITTAMIKGIDIVYGNYPYMKYDFTDILVGLGANVRKLGLIFNSGNIMGSNFSNEILAVMSPWKAAYAAHLHVVESDIPVGTVGIIYKDDCSLPVRQLIDLNCSTY